MKYNKIVSGNTVARLPKYIRLLNDLEQRDVDHVSSGEIGRLLGLTPSQVRQDLSCFGSFGAQGYGYNVPRLKHGLQSIMGLDRTHNVVIMGAGSIGKALLCHMRFKENNYRVVAAFDVNKELIGSELNGTKVYHPEQLKYLHEKCPIDICVLTVPAEQAKHTAKTIADLGISAIWNLTNVDLGLQHRNVVVEDMHFLDSLFSLTFYLEEAQDAVAGRVI